MKPLLFILIVALTACQRVKPIDSCDDVVVWITNQGELHTLHAKFGAAKTEDWAISCLVRNEGRRESWQITVKKGETYGYRDFQSSDKITTFKKWYCGKLIQ